MKPFNLSPRLIRKDADPIEVSRVEAEIAQGVRVCRARGLTYKQAVQEACKAYESDLRCICIEEAFNGG